jgi:hypothetical protein
MTPAELDSIRARVLPTMRKTWTLFGQDSVASTQVEGRISPDDFTALCAAAEGGATLITAPPDKPDVIEVVTSMARMIEIIGFHMAQLIPSPDAAEIRGGVDAINDAVGRLRKNT